MPAYFMRDNPEHVSTEHLISVRSIWSVSISPFEETIAKPGVSLSEAIEQIDIGGPTIRSG